MVAYPYDWKMESLENIAPLQRGFDLPTSQINHGNYPIVYSNGILNYHNDYKCEPPGVVTGRSGTIGNFTFVEERYWPHNTSLWVTDFKGNVPLFIYYFYQTIGIEKMATGTGVPTLNRNDIHNEVYAIPASKDEQKAIASALSDFDEHIDNLTELIEKKKAIRDGALEDLMSGRTRLDGFGGEWEDGTVGNILTVLHGKNQHLVESFSGKYPILGTGGIMGRATEFICDWECVLIGRKGTIDRPFYMHEPFWVIDTLYYSKPKADQCVKFQYCLFCTINWYDYAESSGRPSLTRKAIEGIPISIPDIREQQAIAQILTAMDEEIESLEAEKAKMMQIRDGAMDDLLSGRVRLRV